MKVLEIIYSLGSGGAERFVVDLSNELCEIGHEVTLCTLRDDSVNEYGFYLEDVRADINYINLKIPEGFRPSTIYKLLEVINKVKPDVIHCHLNLVNYILPIIPFFPGIQFFHTIHSDPQRETNGTFEYYLRKLSYSKKLMKSITISDDTSLSYQSYYKVLPYHQIENGRAIPMPSQEFGSVLDQIEQLKQNQNTVFLHIGRFTHAKNQLMLVNVFNRLAGEGQHLILLIIGPGFDTLEGEQLRKRACDKIYFLGSQHNVADYLLNADAFCLSSIYEGMPISLIEAMACGCTPICTPVGGIKNMLKDRSKGVLSASVTEEDYYQAIRYYLNNKNSFRRNALTEYYENNFSMKRCVREYIYCFEKESHE